LLKDAVLESEMDYKRWIVAVGTLFFFTMTCWAEEPQIEHMAVLVAHKDLRGISGGQLLSVLEVLDQTDNENDWLRYQEFYTESSKYIGEYDFKLPESVLRKSIGELVLNVNYRGPKYEIQPWNWSLWNYKLKKWMHIGANQQAPSWRWIKLHFDISKNVKDVIDADGNIKLRYSTSGTDASAMDYLALEVKPVSWWQPSPGLSWQYQLVDVVDTSVDSDVFVVDMFDTPPSVIDELHAKGRHVVCEINAGLWEDWRVDAGRYPESILGLDRVDWAGERWVDFRQMDVLGPILKDRFKMAAEKKCDAIEPDNLDAIINVSGFDVTYEDQLKFSRWLADEAHALGLAIVLKNNLMQIVDLIDHFDMALNEECYEQQLCDKLLPFINAGKAVFIVEYQGLLDDFCLNPLMADFSFIKKDLMLDSLRQSC